MATLQTLQRHHANKQCPKQEVNSKQDFLCDNSMTSANYRTVSKFPDIYRFSREVLTSQISITFVDLIRAVVAGLKDMKDGKTS